MATERTAQVTWQGDLLSGVGTVHVVGSGAFGPLDVSWPSRAEEPDGRTSPEELIAAAWASCYSMALSHGLAQGGTPPDRLDTSVTVTFQPGEGIIRGAITVRAAVPGIGDSAFADAAAAAKVGCPVSKAMTGVPEVTLDAALA